MDKIKQLILRLGIRSTYKGFLYLAYALTLCIQDESYLLSIYTRLYADVGKHYNVSKDNVEHCLRKVSQACLVQNGLHPPQHLHNLLLHHSNSFLLSIVANNAGYS